MSSGGILLDALLASDEFDSGTVLFEQGAPVRDVFWVTDGLVKLMVRATDGVQRIVGCRGANHLLGGAGAVLRQPHRLTAVTAQATRVRRFPLAEFSQLSTTDASFIRFSLHAISCEVERSTDDSIRPFLHTPEQRVARLLVPIQADASARASDEIGLPPGITQEDLAALLEVAPLELTWLLRAWERSGFVRRLDGVLMFRRSAFRPDDAAIESAPDHARRASRGTAYGAHAGGPSGGIVDRVVHFICDHHPDPDLSLALVSRHLDRSVSYLSRCFNQTTGVRFRQFVRGVRIERARELLVSTHLLVKEIAASVGYKHTSDFTRDFVTVHGVSPTIYRLGHAGHDHPPPAPGGPSGRA